MVSGSRGGLGASQRLLSASSFQTRCRPGPDEETVATAIPSPVSAPSPFLASPHPLPELLQSIFQLDYSPSVKTSIVPLPAAQGIKA